MATRKRKETPPHDEVERRAYELFLSRGGEHGYDVEDWLRAEQELAARTGDGEKQAPPAGVRRRRTKTTDPS